MAMSAAVLAVASALNGLPTLLIVDHTSHSQSHDSQKNNTYNHCTHDILLSYPVQRLSFSLSQTLLYVRLAVILFLTLVYTNTY